MIVIVAATSEVAIPTLERISKSENQLLRIISAPDSKSGRGKVLTPSPVSKWADAKGVELLKPNSIQEMQEAFHGADIVLAISYGRIIDKKILEIPKHGFLNLHFSLLPAYRGAAPVQRAIANGDSTSGITIFKIDENLDTGPIYVQEKYEIPNLASSDQVLEKLSNIGALAFERAFAMIASSVSPVEQSSEGISFAPKISKHEAKINWNQSADKILYSIRAFTSSPGAWTLFRGSTVKITSASIGKFPDFISPAELRVHDRRLFIGTQDDPIEIFTIIPSGKQQMKVGDWINGARLNLGEYFE